MKKIIIFLIYLFITQLYVYSNNTLKWGVPGTNGTILNHQAYSLLHDNIKKIPLWVSYYLSAKDLLGIQKRTDDFRPDPNLQAGKRAELLDYKDSGYDRGHMAPAGDMTRNRKVMSESFFLSNILPQNTHLNRWGLWYKLEKKVREYTRRRLSAFIICGPIFKDLDGDGIGDPLEKIGANKVWVPTHCYKIIVNGGEDKLEVTAFIIPNKRISGSLISYLATVDNIELLTGLDFLSKLPNDVEEKVEANKTGNTIFWETKVKQ